MVMMALSVGELNVEKNIARRSRERFDPHELNRLEERTVDGSQLSTIVRKNMINMMARFDRR